MPRILVFTLILALLSLPGTTAALSAEERVPGIVSDVAAVKAPTLGPAPVKCFPAGCYGGDVGPNVMDNTSVGELDLAPHIVQSDQAITANVSFGDWKSDFCNVYDPAGTTTEPRHTCTFKLGASSGRTWGRLRANYCLYGCGTEEDFYYVLPSDKTAITGMVRRADGAGVEGIRIEISGPTNYFAITQGGGFYQAVNIEPGKYTVKGPPGFCAVDPTQRIDEGAAAACPQSRAIDVTKRTAAVDFDEEAFAVSGTVVQQTCSPSECTRTPLGGIPIAAKTGKRTTTTSTAGDGTYSLRLGRATWTIGPTSTDRAFDPATARVSVNGTPKNGVDFVQCATPDAAARVARGEPAAAPKSSCPVKLRVFVVDRASPPAPVRSGFEVRVAGPVTITRPADGGNDFTNFLLKPGEYTVGVTSTTKNAGIARDLYCLGTRAKKLIKPCTTRAKASLAVGATKPVDLNFVRTSVCDMSGYQHLPNDPPSIGASLGTEDGEPLVTAAKPPPGERRLYTLGPVLGATLHGSGQPIVGRLGKVTAALDSTLWVVSPYIRKIDINDHAGRTVRLPAVKEGQEIILQLCVHDTILNKNLVFTSGPGSRNDDKLPHAKMKEFGESVVVSFEDTPEYSTPGHPDRDFDEFVITLKGVGLGGKVSGLVRKLNDRGGFVPARGVRVVLTSDDRTLTATTGTNGRYEFKDLDENDYVVSVPTGYCAEPFSIQRRKHVDCKERKSVSVNEQHKAVTVNFEQESYELRVLVKDKSNPVRRHAGVNVKAAGVGNTKSLPNGVTSEGGSYDFGRVPAGTYRFNFTFPPGSDLAGTRICLNEDPSPDKCVTEWEQRLWQDDTIVATALTLGELVVEITPERRSIRSGLGIGAHGFVGFYEDTPSKPCHHGCGRFIVKVDLKNGDKDALKAIHLEIVGPGSPQGVRVVNGEGKKSLCIGRIGESLPRCRDRFKDLVPLGEYNISYWAPGVIPVGVVTESDPLDIQVRATQTGYIPGEAYAKVTVRANRVVDREATLGEGGATLILMLGEASSSPRFVERFCTAFKQTLEGFGIQWLVENAPLIGGPLKKFIGALEKACKVAQLDVTVVKTFVPTWVGLEFLGAWQLPTDGLAEPDPNPIDLGPPPKLKFKMRGGFFPAIEEFVRALGQSADALRISPNTRVFIEVFEVTHAKTELFVGEPTNRAYERMLWVRLGVVEAGHRVVLHEAEVREGYLPAEWLKAVGGR